VLFSFIGMYGSLVLDVFLKQIDTYLIYLFHDGMKVSVSCKLM
jgi:hypothetical protein